VLAASLSPRTTTAPASTEATRLTKRAPPPGVRGRAVPPAARPQRPARGSAGRRGGRRASVRAASTPRDLTRSWASHDAPASAAPVARRATLRLRARRDQCSRWSFMGKVRLSAPVHSGRTVPGRRVPERSQVHALHRRLLLAADRVAARRGSPRTATFLAVCTTGTGEDRGRSPSKAIQEKFNASDDETSGSGRPSSRRSGPTRQAPLWVLWTGLLQARALGEVPAAPRVVLEGTKTAGEARRQRRGGRPALLDEIDGIAEIFWETRSRRPHRRTARRGAPAPFFAQRRGGSPVMILRSTRHRAGRSAAGGAHRSAAVGRPASRSS